MILETISSRDLLIDAYKFYHRRDARAHDALAIILERDDMSSAVLGCLERASKEEEPDQQRLYCQAACFGKKFHPGIAIQEYNSTCRAIRVRNVCKRFIDGPCFEPSEIIEQLIEKRKYDQALWAVRYLKISGEDKLLQKWCEDLMQSKHLTDEDIASRIQHTLGQAPLISYASIAEKAMYYDRITLAIKLIDNEGQSSKKIPLLLSMKQYDLVLSHALATCDTNLIYAAIFKLQTMMISETQFIELMKKHRHAFRYYCNYLAVTDTKRYPKYHYSMSGRDDLCFLLADENLESALIASRKANNEFVNHQIDVSIKLSRFQQSLKQVEPPPMSDSKEWLRLSISDTIINLIALGHTTKAKECRKEFEVSDRKFKLLEQIATNSLPKFELPSIET